MFRIDHNAREYVQKQGGAIIINLTFQPAMGGCPCAGRKIMGCYVPAIAIGRPAVDDKAHYEVVEVEEIQIFYPVKLAVKEGFAAIHIHLRNLVAFKWLEIEGAAAISLHD